MAHCSCSCTPSLCGVNSACVHLDHTNDSARPVWSRPTAEQTKVIVWKQRKFLATDPKIFLKAPLAPIYTNFEGGARAKKTQFFGQNFPKSPKNAFFGLFFQNFACGAKIFAKTGTKLCVGRARKINSVDLTKKRSTKFLKIRPPPPPRENPRSAPVVHYSRIIFRKLSQCRENPTWFFSTHTENETKMQ